MIQPTGPKRPPKARTAVTGHAGPEVGQAAAELAPPAQRSPRYLTDEQRRWLADLYRSDFPRVFRLCRRVLGNPDDAADAAHQTFLKAIDSFPPGSATKDISPWLLTVARNHCIDELRRRKRLGSVMVDLAADRDRDSDPEGPVMDRQVVAAIFEQLHDRERQALWQSAVEQRSLGEIARDLRLSYMAAAQLLHRARRRAYLLAMRLAALIGLLQLGRAAKRATMKATQLLSVLRHAHPESSAVGAPHLLVVLAIPLALATVQSSSSPPPAPPLPPAHVVSSAPAPVVPGGGVLKAEGTQETLSAIQKTLPGAITLPPIPLPVPTPALSPIVSSTGSLPSPSLPSPSLPSPSLPSPSLPSPSLPDVGGIISSRHL